LKLRISLLFVQYAMMRLLEFLSQVRNHTIGHFIRPHCPLKVIFELGVLLVREYELLLQLGSTANYFAQLPRNFGFGNAGPLLLYSCAVQQNL